MPSSMLIMLILALLMAHCAAHITLLLLQRQLLVEAVAFRITYSQYWLIDDNI